MPTWSIQASSRLAADHMAGMGDRWLHVQAVGAKAASLSSRPPDDVVVCAAWLHDVGYAESVSVTGFHPLDGARFLQSLEAPEEIIGLVAYHSGAEYEAEQRGLTAELAELVRPDQANLDFLTLVDMTTSPAGEPVSVEERIAEILDRYSSEHPVNKAIESSQAYLRQCAERAEARLSRLSR